MQIPGEVRSMTWALIVKENVWPVILASNSRITRLFGATVREVCDGPREGVVVVDAAECFEHGVSGEKACPR